MSKKDTSYWYQRTIDQLLISGRSQNTADSGDKVNIGGIFV